MNWEQYISETIRILKTGEWPNGVPTVRANLRVAINSLLRQDNRLFDRDTQAIIDLIHQDNNRRVREILSQTPADSLALAIREVRNIAKTVAVT